MINKSYVLNDRYKVVPVSNEIMSLVDNEVIKIEPRVMRVLCLLIAKPNEVIERKDMIHEIWENYGGADEGLTQAVSHLRKILDTSSEDDQSIIETITKKGYRIKARVDVIDPYNERAAHSKRHVQFLYAIIGILIISIIAILIVCSQPEEVLAPKADPVEELK